MKLFLLSTLIGLLLITNVNAQNGFGDNFNDNTLSCRWTNQVNYDTNKRIAYNLTETDGILRVDVDIMEAYENFQVAFPVIDISSNPVLALRIKSSNDFRLSAYVGDTNEYNTNANIYLDINAGIDFQDYRFDFTGRLLQTFPSDQDVNPKAIITFGFFVNPGSSSYTNTFYMEDVQIGTAGSQNGGIESCILTNLENKSIQHKDKVLMRIFTPLGQEVKPEQTTEGLFIYQYSDGSTDKVMKLE